MHAITAVSNNNLGRVMWDQGHLTAARARFENALAIREQVLGPEHPDTATSLNNLASLFQSQGRLSEAHEAGQASRRLRPLRLGPDSKLTHPSDL